MSIDIKEKEGNCFTPFVVYQYIFFLYQIGSLTVCFFLKEKDELCKAITAAIGVLREKSIRKKTFIGTDESKVL